MKALMWLTEECRRREKEGRSGQEPRILAVFDRLENYWGLDMQKGLMSLLSTGPAVGIHLMGVLADGNEGMLEVPLLWKAKTFIASAPVHANGNILVSSVAFDKTRRSAAYNGPWHLMSMFRFGEDAPRIVDMWAKMQKPEWDESLLASLKSSEPCPLLSADLKDPLISLATQIVTATRNGSISHLQRKLKVGYMRASALMDTMRALCIVGPSNGSKPCEVLMTPEEAQAAVDAAIAEMVPRPFEG